MSAFICRTVLEKQLSFDLQSLVFSYLSVLILPILHVGVGVKSELEDINCITAESKTSALNLSCKIPH